MLRVITLHTIQQIFQTEATQQVSAMAQMAYIRCLTHYFADLPANRENCVAFTLRFAQMNNGPRSRKYFEELAQAGLVTLTDKTVEFLPVWHRHIDRSKLDPTDVMERVGIMTGARPAEDYRNDIENNQSFKDLIGMKHGISEQDLEARVKPLIDEFLKEQQAKHKVYYNPTEAIGHCISWIGKRLPVVDRAQMRKAAGNFIGW